MRALALVLLLAAPAASAGFLAVPDPGPRATSEVGGATVYPTWPILTAELQTLAAEHRDILRLTSAGQSARGLDLWLVEIADFENPDKVPLESREVLWIDGGTHANEYSGVMFVVHLLKWLARGYGENETATWIVENRRTFIMPLVNPEGSLNGIGRLNDNLVNINRNYPVGWGDLEEAPVVNNPGPYGGSEAETQTVMAAWAAIRPDYVASIHCCGNLWLYPYGIEGRDPHVDDSPVFARICDEAYADVREDCGPIWSTIYPASGSSADTAYEMFGSAAFGFEMSGREALAAWGQPFTTTPVEETEYESWRGVLHAFLHVEKYGAHPVAAVEAVLPGEVRLTVTNDGWGNLTRATVAVADADGVLREAVVPRLAAGASATVVVPGRFAPGDFPVEVRYQKRALGGEAVVADVLGVVAQGGALVGALGAAPDAVAAEEDTVAVPGAGAAALVALAAVAAVAAGRRR